MPWPAGPFAGLSETQVPKPALPPTSREACGGPSTPPAPPHSQCVSKCVWLRVNQAIHKDKILQKEMTNPPYPMTKHFWGVTKCSLVNKYFNFRREVLCYCTQPHLHSPHGSDSLTSTALWGPKEGRGDRWPQNCIWRNMRVTPATDVYIITEPRITSEQLGSVLCCQTW